MTHVNPAVAQTELHFSREAEQTQEVGYRGTLLAYALAQTLPGEIILIDQLF